MRAKTNRVDTNALFRGMIGNKPAEESKVAEVQPVQTPLAAVEEKVKKVGRPADDEKKTQVSLYLTDSLVKGLRVQSAEQEKESDRSALARTGIEIALALSNDEYKELKEAAARQGKTPGQIVSAALVKYLRG